MRDLIYDVGMHHGHDTGFYLAKGFNVVAVEANPKLAQKNRERFAAEIGAKRLHLLNLAIAEREGPVTFWANDQNDDWSTISEAFLRRNEQAGTTSTSIVVQGKPLQQILDEYGTPYYLKIDIEGSDTLCLRALKDRELPQYVSVEADFTTTDTLFEQLSTLWTLGFRKFKILNQACNRWTRCPRPALEGKYVQTTFGLYSSGLFGEETPGKWLSAAEMLGEAKPMIWEQRMFGFQAPHSRSVPGRAYIAMRRVMRKPVAWYDIHATVERKTQIRPTEQLAA
jgi:FkbM family methyltransferase